MANWLRVLAAHRPSAVGVNICFEILRRLGKFHSSSSVEDRWNSFVGEASRPQRLLNEMIKVTDTVDMKLFSESTIAPFPLRQHDAINLFRRWLTFTDSSDAGMQGFDDACHVAKLRQRVEGIQRTVDATPVGSHLNVPIVVITSPGHLHEIQVLSCSADYLRLVGMEFVSSGGTLINESAILLTERCVALEHWGALRYALINICARRSWTTARQLFLIMLSSLMLKGPIFPAQFQVVHWDGMSNFLRTFNHVCDSSSKTYLGSSRSVIVDPVHIALLHGECPGAKEFIETYAKAIGRIEVPLGIIEIAANVPSVCSVLAKYAVVYSSNDDDVPQNLTSSPTSRYVSNAAYDRFVESNPFWPFHCTQSGAFRGLLLDSGGRVLLQNGDILQHHSLLLSETALRRAFRFPDGFLPRDSLLCSIYQSAVFQQSKYLLRHLDIEENLLDADFNGRCPLYVLLSYVEPDLYLLSHLAVKLLVRDLAPSQGVEEEMLHSLRLKALLSNCCSADMDYKNWLREDPRGVLVEEFEREILNISTYISIIKEMGLRGMATFAGSSVSTLLDSVVRAQRLLSLLPLSIIGALERKPDSSLLSALGLMADLDWPRCLRIRDLLVDWHKLRLTCPNNASISVSMKCRGKGLFLASRPIHPTLDSLSTFLQSESRGSVISMKSPVSTSRLKMLFKLFSNNRDVFMTAIDVSLLILELSRALVNARLILQILNDPLEPVNPVHYHLNRIQQCKIHIERLKSTRGIDESTVNCSVISFLNIPEALSSRFTKLRRACILAVFNAHSRMPDQEICSEELENLISSLDRADEVEDAAVKLKSFVDSEILPTSSAGSDERALAIIQDEEMEVRELLLLEAKNDRSIVNSRRLLAERFIAQLQEAYSFASHIVDVMMCARWRHIILAKRLNPMVPLCRIRNPSVNVPLFYRLLDAGFSPFLHDGADVVAIHTAALVGNAALLHEMLNLRRYQTSPDQYLLWHVLFGASIQVDRENDYIEVIDLLLEHGFPTSAAVGTFSSLHLALLKGFWRVADKCTHSDREIDDLETALLLLSEDLSCFYAGLKIIQRMHPKECMRKIAFTCNSSVCVREHHKFYCKAVPWRESQEVLAATTKNMAILEKTLRTKLQMSSYAVGAINSGGPKLLNCLLKGFILHQRRRDNNRQHIKETNPDLLEDSLLQAVVVLRAIVSELPQSLFDIFDFACTSGALSTIWPHFEVPIERYLFIRGVEKSKCHDFDCVYLLNEAAASMLPVEFNRLLVEPIQTGISLLSYAVQKSLLKFTEKIIQFGGYFENEDDKSSLLRLSISARQGRFTQILSPRFPLENLAAAAIGRFVRKAVIRCRRMKER